MTFQSNKNSINKNSINKNSINKNSINKNNFNSSKKILEIYYGSWFSFPGSNKFTEIKCQLLLNMK